MSPTHRTVPSMLSMSPTHSTVPSMLSMVLPLRRDLLKVGGDDVHLAVEDHETVQGTGA